MPNCPECGSSKTWRDGLRYNHTRTPIQRFLCRECGYRFSESNGFSRKITNSSYNKQGSRQICVSECEMKNLVKVEPRTGKRAAGATIDKATIKGRLIEFAWHLKKQGRSEATIKTYTKYLKIMCKAGADIFDPETIKLTIATHFKEQNTKRLATYAYDAFLGFLGITWKKPKYLREEKKVFVPTDEKLWLAVNCGHKSSVAFSMLCYETGARFNEAQRIEWTDIDRERSKITIKASKNGNARIISVSKRLVELLLSLPKREKTVFPKRSRNARQANFHKRMEKLARDHNNPRMKLIHYHTFRHAKALREYDKTRSILHVKKTLGHKSIMTTQRYVELYTEIYGDLKPENYVCETASTVKEAKRLVECGFDYVCEIEGEQLFRKVK